MATPIQIRRRVTGATGGPTGLLDAEIAYNEVDNTFWYTNSGGAVKPLGGLGLFFDLNNSQTVAAGTKTFAAGTTLDVSAGTLKAPTVATGDNSTNAATTAWVRLLAPTLALSAFAAATASVNVGNQTLINVASPVNPTDGANKSYVDAAIQGIDFKPTANAATAAPLPANTYSNGTNGAGATLTATANAALTVDGVAMAAGMVVLVKNEATAANNGLYTVTAPGSGTTAYVLTRHVDMNSSAEVPGAFVPVMSGGTANANSLWLCNPSGAVTIGTTALPFTQLNGATDLAAGNGISISANTVAAVAASGGGLSVGGGGISIASIPSAVQSAITALGTIASGTWQGSAIGSAYGGLGVNASAASGYALWASGAVSFSATIPTSALTGSIDGGTF